MYLVLAQRFGTYGPGIFTRDETSGKLFGVPLRRYDRCHAADREYLNDTLQNHIDDI